MKFEEFNSGKYIRQQGYKSFSPAKINQQWTWEEGKINTLLAEANRKLGSLDTFALQVPDIDIFIEMHIAKEAAKSSRIEGTQTEIEEALKKESGYCP
jgi:Fic family protein